MFIICSLFSVSIDSTIFNSPVLNKSIGTIIHYPIPPHMQECYAKESWNTPQLSLPITEIIANTELSLPISPVQTKEETEEVVNAINSFKI